MSGCPPTAHTHLYFPVKTDVVLNDIPENLKQLFASGKCGDVSKARFYIDRDTREYCEDSNNIRGMPVGLPSGKAKGDICKASNAIAQNVFNGGDKTDRGLKTIRVEHEDTRPPATKQELSSRDISREVGDYRPSTERGVSYQPRTERDFSRERPELDSGDIEPNRRRNTMPENSIPASRGERIIGSVSRNLERFDKLREDHPNTVQNLVGLAGLLANVALNSATKKSATNRPSR